MNYGLALSSLTASFLTVNATVAGLVTRKVSSLRKETENQA
jgi:hypothetical protein